MARVAAPATAKAAAGTGDASLHRAGGRGKGRTDESGEGAGGADNSYVTSVRRCDDPDEGREQWRRQLR